MPGRRVVRAPAFLEAAHRLFPDQPAEGAPSFALFERGPLRGAEIAFSRNFEAQREAVDGVGSIRYVTIPPTPVFGPLVIAACLLLDGTVEIVSVINDAGYWGMVGDDPAE
ncbi:MAG: hypothetical protein ABIS21_08425 [Acidimicrobiales bacterium]